MRKLGPIGFPTLFQCSHLSNPGVSPVRAEFLEALRAAVAAYVEARVDVGDTGMPRDRRSPPARTSEA